MNISAHNSTLRIGGQAVPFELQKGKARSIRLSFTEEARLLIHTGDGKLGDFELDFLKQKARWVLKCYRETRKMAEQKSSFLASIDQAVTILGTHTPVEFIPATNTHFKFRKHSHFKVHAPGHLFQSHKKALLYYSLRCFAEHYLPQRVEHWQEITGLSINQLRVKDVTSRWGSCSTRRNINLNWHLVLLEDHLIDYVIVHELMHLHEMNHSSRFWDWVGKYFPEYKKARKQLKEKKWMVGILK